MKSTLAFDAHAKQFKTDVAGKRFYLGGNAAEAEQRKLALNRYRGRVGEWTPDTLAVAKRIAKGEPTKVPAHEDEQAYYAKELELVGAGVPVTPAVTTSDLAAAEMALLRERVRAINSAPSNDADLNASEITPYLDESGNNLKFRVKYSNGTLRTATVALS